ncbi:MAG TPA: DUF2092 domain-containing protein, partial [Sphingomicrobium sp.]|nr:DUF2092 domain-containing protein [Sphingomicrobium sp.]
MSRFALMSLCLPLALSASAATAQASPTAKDPAAMAALDRMGAALAKKMEVNVHADITAEDVLESGQKVEYGGTVDIIARRPDKLKLTLAMGPSQRVLYYDGKTLTMSAPSLGYYASTAAPATIKEMLVMAQDRFGLEIPLADLFMWSADPTLAAKVTSAIALGTETIGGFACEHYAMRQQGVDWQIWLREGENALPCKLVIGMTGDPAIPEFS